MQSRDIDTANIPILGRQGLTRLAERLEDGRRRNVSVDCDAATSIAVDAGYAVQRAGRSLRTEVGERVVGYKIGLTSAPAQELFSATEPIRGYLFDTTVVNVDKPVSLVGLFGPGDTPVSLAGLFEPRLEVEIAFLLKDTLAGPAVTTDDVLTATGELAMSLEIVDSRWTGGARNLGMLTADNANAARVVLGPRLPVRGVDLSSIEVELLMGRDRQIGHATNVMGDPANAVAWLATHLTGHGECLEAGHVVMSGTLTAPLRVSPGDAVTADFGDLGQLHVQFEG